MSNPTPLEISFHNDMLNIYRTAKKDCGYKAQIFLQMVSNDGGRRAAQKLLATALPSEGFFELKRHDRLDLTMEYLVLQPKYRSLFTDSEIATARQRLVDYGFTGKLPD